MIAALELLVVADREGVEDARIVLEATEVLLIVELD